jgi:hypothetical protein
MTETKANLLGFEAKMCGIRSDFHRLTNDFLPLEQCAPFSPQAYNAIASVVLESIYTCIDRISSLFDPNTYYYNLGVILYKELLSETCTHYFGEYERIFNFVDPCLDRGHFISRQPGFSETFFHKLSVKTSGIIMPLVRTVAKPGGARIGWAGTTTFPWSGLALGLVRRGIGFTSIQAEDCVVIPESQAQITILYQWADDLHLAVAEALNTPPQSLNKFDSKRIASIVEPMLSLPRMVDNPIDLLITGSLGEIDARLYALQAQARKIPVMTIYHGAFYAYDEPWWPLYENALPDIKIMYGQVDKQYIRDSVNTNLAGKSIRIYSRSDSHVQAIYKEGEIHQVSLLRGLKAVHLSAGGGWQKQRYGPYRDVHPATYLKWQEALLIWLEKQTGKRPYVRLHPKRDETRYDPVGYTNIGGDMLDVLDAADVYVIDFPTTSLAYISATKKPVLFFDIGLRRLHSEALRAIQGRCHYAEVDLMAPEAGFETMHHDLSRECSHTFVPTYCLSENSGQSEVEAVSDAVSRLFKAAR